jgi:hypothetical protein
MGRIDGIRVPNEIAHLQLHLPVDAVVPDLAFIAHPGIHVGFGGMTKRIRNVQRNALIGIPHGGIADADLVLPANGGAHFEPFQFVPQD